MEDTRALLIGSVPPLDQPGHGRFTAMRVGTDANGTLALAVGATTEGALVAYACDGETTGIWFTASAEDMEASPGTVRLRQDGAELALRAADLRASDGAPTQVQLSMNGAVLPIDLAPAGPYAGMYRFTDDADTTSRLASWVLLNDGRIFGVDSAGGALKTREVAAPSDLPDSIDVADGPVETPEDPYLFNRFRCGRIVLRVYQFTTAAGGADLSNSPFMREQRGLFEHLGCEELGFELIGTGRPAT